MATPFVDQAELKSNGKYADFLLAVLAAVAQLERQHHRREALSTACLQRAPN